MIFCIGYNKTGTTSLAEFFRINGFKVAPQRPFEKNVDKYIDCDFESILHMIENEYSEYSFFQDVPFSLPGMYVHLYKRFKTAKFILSVRDNESEWYDSLVNHHSSIKDKSSFYIKGGWIRKVIKKSYGTNDDDIYNRESLTESYVRHIKDCEDFFSDKPGSLIKINVSDPNSPDMIEEFIGSNFTKKNMPHLNKRR